MPYSEYNSKTLEEDFTFKKVKSENAIRNTAHYLNKYYKPSGKCMKDYFLARFPFLLWIVQYEFKSCFVKDLAAGITVSYLSITVNSCNSDHGSPPNNLL